MASFATYVIVVVCCVGNSVLCHPVNNEPQCYSKFDYDVKLLEKMVNLEHRVNLSERLLRDEIINLEAEKKRLEENVDSLSKQLTEEQERATKEIKLKSEEADAKLETMLANISQKSDQVDSKLETMLANFSQKSDQVDSKVDTKIDSLSKQLTEEQERATKEIKLKSEEVDAKLETMLANFSQKSDQVDAKVDTKIDSLSKQLTEDQERATKEIKLKSEEVDAKLETMLANFSQLADRTTADQKAFADGVETSLSGLELRTNTSLQAFAEKAVKPAVAFYMRYTGTSSPGYNAMLKFSTAFVNTNNVYDTQTGIFTAPVSGVYVFSVQICGYTSQYINFRIYVNDDMISDTTEYDKDSSYHCTSTNAVAMLDVGDKVCVKTGPNTIRYGNTLYSDIYRWSTFMGTLVH